MVQIMVLQLNFFGGVEIEIQLLQNTTFQPEIGGF
jgi:hypothetical protein